MIPSITKEIEMIFHSLFYALFNYVNHYYISPLLTFSKLEISSAVSQRKWNEWMHVLVFISTSDFFALILPIAGVWLWPYFPGGNIFIQGENNNS